MLALAVVAYTYWRLVKKMVASSSSMRAIVVLCPIRESSLHDIAARELTPGQLLVPKLPQYERGLQMCSGKSFRGRVSLTVYMHSMVTTGVWRRCALCLHLYRSFHPGRSIQHQRIKPDLHLHLLETAYRQSSTLPP